MGRYTALDDPIVDQTVEAHMRQIVKTIRSRVDPRSIFLRGSFGRGEGSVVVEGQGLRSLSDYELAVVMPLREYRRNRRGLQADIQKLSDRLGVEMSISRYGLGSSSTGRIAHPTLDMYEVQNGGIVLYGEDLLNHRQSIDPRTLDMWDGLRLMLNRMAESLDYLSETEKDWQILHWINKVVLSCAEALLITHGQYHFSYAERGRRFAHLVPELDIVVKQAQHLPELVARATVFKLRPSCDLYSEPVPLIWERVKQVCDVTFRYVIGKYLSLGFDTYAEFPERYLRQLREQNKLGKSWIALLPAPFSQNLFLVMKLLRDRQLPSLGLLTHTTYPAYQMVFSLVPLLFLWNGERVILGEVRRWLGQIRRLRAPVDDVWAEWDYLRTCTKRAWKDFCYGRWNIIQWEG